MGDESYPSGMRRVAAHRGRGGRLIRRTRTTSAVLRAVAAIPVTWMALSVPIVSSAYSKSSASSHGAGALRPVELRCDGMVDPLGVDATPPRLSWQLRGEGRGLRQTAWQVLAASSRQALDRDGADVWDSGRVDSAEQLHVPFGGRALRSAEPVFWKVRVWDGEGRSSAWGAPPPWTTGVL
jgi:alpha-L-rhamnosidase